MDDKFPCLYCSRHCNIDEKHFARGFENENTQVVLEDQKYHRHENKRSIDRQLPWVTREIAHKIHYIARNHE